MPALTQSQIQSLPDVISGDRFTINFGVIPTFGDTSTSLLLKCMDVYLPGTNNERFEVPLGSVYRSFRGKKNYQRLMQMTFVETVDMSSVAAIRQWLEYIAGTNSGNSQSYIDGYSTTPVITAYDTTGSAADTVKLYRCFPVALQDIPLTTQQSAPMILSAEFSYDYPVFANTTVT